MTSAESNRIANWIRRLSELRHDAPYWTNGAFAQDCRDAAEALAASGDCSVCRHLGTDCDGKCKPPPHSSPVRVIKQACGSNTLEAYGAGFRCYVCNAIFDKHMRPDTSDAAIAKATGGARDER